MRPEVSGLGACGTVGQIPVCENAVASTLLIACPVWVPRLPSEGTFVTPRPASFGVS